MIVETNLGLSSNTPIRGRRFESHEMVYHHVQRLIIQGALTPPLDWIHIDGHDDIGGLSTSLDITPANYLLHCIKEGWIANLIFSLPDGYGDLSAYYVKDTPLRIEVDGHTCRICHQDTETFITRRTPDYLYFVLSPSYSPLEIDTVFNECERYIINEGEQCVAGYPPQGVGSPER